MLTFRHDTHTYLWKGKPVQLSVTDVLKLAGIIDTTWYTEFGRDRGTAAHRAIQLYLAGLLDESSVDPLVLPYVNAFIDFLNFSKFRIYASERPVYSRFYKYAGTFDLYGLMNGRRWIIDFKTGPLQDSDRLQTAAYFQAASEDRMKPTNRAALRLRQNGSYLLQPHTDAGDFNKFLTALTTAKKARKEQNGNTPPEIERV